MGSGHRFRHDQPRTRITRAPQRSVSCAWCLSHFLRRLEERLVHAGVLRLKYTELHARSAFSFLEGSSNPEELAALCAEREMSAMAVLDRDGVYGAPRFYLAANKAKIK